MSRLSTIATGALLALLMAIPATPAMAQRFRGGGHGYFGGPHVFMGVGPGFYGPGFYGGYYGYGPYFYPGYGYYYGYYPQSNSGKIKIDTKTKDESIYVDGGYVGETGKTKTFGLTAGNHDVEVRDATGHTLFKEKVQVVVGQTVDIKPHA